MGRRPKYTQERVQAIVFALRQGNTRKAACAAGGLSVDTFARWLGRFADFADAIKKAESAAEIERVGVVRRAGMGGNWTAAAWWLERRRPDEWGKTDRLEILQIVRQTAAEHGLSDEETAAAVAEAESYLKELKRARG